METNSQPKLPVTNDELETTPVTEFPNVEAYCRGLREQGIGFQIIPMRINPSSNKET